MSDTVTLSAEALEVLVEKAMLASDTSMGNAKAVARALAQAEIDGQKGHGFSRVPTYSAQAKSGKVKGHATPQANAIKPGALMVDVAHGFFYPAFDLALERLPDMAAANGVAAAAFRRSHHAGVLGYHVERLAAHGLISMMVGNTPKAMPPWGGKEPIFGTNPIAFGAPRRGGFPVVVDLALSTVARGNIMTAAQAGKPIPEGWATDKDGNPTTDAKKALDGMLMPVGGAKGYALALMVELLAGPLAGAALSTEAGSFFTAEGAPPGVGQTVVVIDPGAFAGTDAFLDRVEDVLGSIEAQEGARVPGARVPELRAKAAKDGITVPKGLLDQVNQIIAGSA